MTLNVGVPYIAVPYGTVVALAVHVPVLNAASRLADVTAAAAAAEQLTVRRPAIVVGNLADQYAANYDRLYRHPSPARSSPAWPRLVVWLAVEPVVICWQNTAIRLHTNSVSLDAGLMPGRTGPDRTRTGRC